MEEKSFVTVSQLRSVSSFDMTSVRDAVHNVLRHIVSVSLVFVRGYVLIVVRWLYTFAVLGFVSPSLSWVSCLVSLGVECAPSSGRTVFCAFETGNPCRPTHHEFL
jgi:hypothetical protein